MRLPGRRNFLKSSLALGALAGPSTDAGEPHPLAAAGSPAEVQVASFGWEAVNLNGNGANAHVPILHNMLLQSVHADVAATILNAKTTGFAEVLCTGAVSRQGMPSFNSGVQAYVNQKASSHFGSVAAHNPNKLSLVMSGMVQDQFLAIILKTWVPGDGAGSATARQLLVHPSLSLSAGDYLVFHMDHAGVTVDTEMQVVITYTLL